MSTVVEIRIGELFVADQSTVITTSGVGSCVVVILYDRLMRVGGMAHTVLPRGKDAGGAPLLKDEIGRGFMKYADRAVDVLLDELTRIGGKKEHMVAKLVGGAHMFSLLEGDKFGIGYENTVSVRERLGYHHIPIETEVVGGTVGRNVRFDCATGIVEITTKV